MLKCKHIKPLKIVTREIGKYFSLILLVVLLLGSSQAYAAASDEVTLTLTANIVRSCALSRNETGVSAEAGGTSPETKTLGTDGKITIDFKISCNNPFKYSLKSINGALINTSSQTVGNNSDTILDQVDYITTFIAKLEDGGTGPTEINQECFSPSLTGTECKSSTPFADSGTAVAIDEDASLSISINGYSNGLLNGVTPLLSGIFQDTLVLKVETPL